MFFIWRGYNLGFILLRIFFGTQILEIFKIWNADDTDLSDDRGFLLVFFTVKFGFAKAKVDGYGFHSFFLGFLEHRFQKSLKFGTRMTRIYRMTADRYWCFFAVKFGFAKAKSDGDGFCSFCSFCFRFQVSGFRFCFKLRLKE